MKAKNIDLAGFAAGGFVVILIWAGVYATVTATPRYDKWEVVKASDCYSIAKDFGPLDYCIELHEAKDMAAKSNARDSERENRQKKINNKEWRLVGDE